MKHKRSCAAAALRIFSWVGAFMAVGVAEDVEKPKGIGVKAKKTRRNILFLVVGSVALLAASFFSYWGVASMAVDAYIEAGQYAEAMTVANRTPFFPKEKAQYIEAGLMMQEGHYVDAAALYEVLGPYEEASTFHKEALYQQAVSLVEENEYAQALEILENEALAGYRDVEEKIQNVAFADYAALFDSGTISGEKSRGLEGIIILAEAGYAPAQQYIQIKSEEIYALAELQMTRLLYGSARKAFSAIAGYEHSQEYIAAINILDEGDPIGQWDTFVEYIHLDACQELLDMYSGLLYHFLKGRWISEDGYLFGFSYDIVSEEGQDDYVENMMVEYLFPVQPEMASFSLFSRVFNGYAEDDAEAEELYFFEIIDKNHIVIHSLQGDFSPLIMMREEAM